MAHGPLVADRLCVSTRLVTWSLAVFHVSYLLRLLHRHLISQDRLTHLICLLFALVYE